MSEVQAQDRRRGARPAPPRPTHRTDRRDAGRGTTAKHSAAGGRAGGVGGAGGFGAPRRAALLRSAPCSAPPASRPARKRRRAGRGTRPPAALRFVAVLRSALRLSVTVPGAGLEGMTDSGPNNAALRRAAPRRAVAPPHPATDTQRHAERGSRDERSAGWRLGVGWCVRRVASPRPALGTDRRSTGREIPAKRSAAGGQAGRASCITLGGRQR